MQLYQSQPAGATLSTLAKLGLLNEQEIAVVTELGGPESRFRETLNLAETLHLHIKVDNTDQLPINDFFKAGAELDHQKQGFVKYRFPGAINAIFSHIKVSQEELIETEVNRRPRPFLDHIGIDLREETAQVRAAFDALPQVAEEEHLPLASQGGPDQPVFCCHVEVAEKHWLYPPDRHGHPGIPLEFAYGALKVNPDKSGCDLRPADPNKVDPASIPTCCGTSAAKSGTDSSPAAQGSYYRTADLGRFGEIGRSNPALANAFFDYYGKAMAEDRLTKREKILIGLAVAHALRCPYCIDSLSGSALDLGLTEAEMMEAVQVAAALSAGIALVHSTQMLGHVDARAAAKH